MPAVLVALGVFGVLATIGALAGGIASAIKHPGPHGKRSLNISMDAQAELAQLSQLVSLSSDSTMVPTWIKERQWRECIDKSGVARPIWNTAHGPMINPWMVINLADTLIPPFNETDEMFNMFNIPMLEAFADTHLPIDGALEPRTITALEDAKRTMDAELQEAFADLDEPEDIQTAEPASFALVNSTADELVAHYRAKLPVEPGVFKLIRDESTNSAILHCPKNFDGTTSSS